MKILITIIFSLFVSVLLAIPPPTYYFSSSGNDDYSTSTMDSAHPWQTLSRLNSVWAGTFTATPSTVAAGTRFLIRAGSVYFGNIVAGASGTSALPIILGTYDNGAAPVISGMITLNNASWVANSSSGVPGGVYSNTNSSFGNSANVVLINGIQQGIGRYPNPSTSSSSNYGWLRLESSTGKNNIKDDDLPDNPDWGGAQAVVRVARFIIDRVTISDHQSGGTLFFSDLLSIQPSTHSSGTGWGYFISNDPRCNDQYGEWSSKNNSHVININFGGANPVNNSSYVTEVAVLDSLFKNNGKSNITITGITFRGSNTENVAVYGGATGVKFYNCQFLFAGRNNVFINAGGNNTVENCIVTNSNNMGIYVRGGTSNIIRNCYVHNSGVFNGLGNNGYNQTNGITVLTDGNLIDNCIVRGVGYCGIDVRNKSRNTVNRCWVDSFEMFKDDAGAIYAFNNNSNKIVTTTSGNVITNNLISNGLDGTHGLPTGNNPESAGIYLDGESNGFLLAGNTIFNTLGHGIFLNNNKNVTVRDNLIFNALPGSVYLHSYRTGTTRDTAFTDAAHTKWSSINVYNHEWSGNLIRHNTFFMKNNSDLAIDYFNEQSPRTDDITSFGIVGGIDSNRYARPISEPDSYSNSNDDIIKANSSSSGNYTLATWKPKYSNRNDQHSSKTYGGISISSVNDLMPLMNPTDHDSVIYLGTFVYQDENGIKKATGYDTLKPYNATVLTKISGTVTNTNMAPTVSITYPIQGVNGVNPPFYIGDQITININAADADGSVNNVKVYNGSSLIATLTDAPYSCTFTPSAIGSITLYAVATDDKGKSTTSTSQIFSIANNSSNTSPDIFKLKRSGKFKVKNN